MSAQETWNRTRVVDDEPGLREVERPDEDWDPKSGVKFSKLSRADREALMVSHEECCDWHPPHARCGQLSPQGRQTCTRAPDHGRKHYDAVECVSWGSD